jgi:outer membrane protein OmpA-like peptidoglycan-associated protein
MSLRFFRLGWLLLLSACMVPPKPPVVDGSHRQPVNDVSTINMLERRARSTGQVEQAEREKIAVLNRQAVRYTETKPAVSDVVDASLSDGYTVVFRHYFPFASTRLNLKASDRAMLLAWVKNADRVEIRGRTDGKRFSPGDEAVAKGRATSARQWLLRHGVAPEKINVNYLSGGDYAADNATSTGRSQNRRVEVVFFSSVPFSNP